jgi:hypothetical protein
VTARVMVDASAPDLEGNATARQWLEHGITRTIVKRNVMTYSYSSRTFGMPRRLRPLGQPPTARS